MRKASRSSSSKGVTIKFLKENLVFDASTEDPRSVLLFTVLSAFAQFERSLIKERQREGIAIAKAKGVYKGRTSTLTPEQVETIKQRIAAGVPKARIAKDLKVTRQTIYNHLGAA
jgi:DNA invertase Pin-like site-specific DNA recombinase